MTCNVKVSELLRVAAYVADPNDVSNNDDGPQDEETPDDQDTWDNEESYAECIAVKALKPAHL